MPPPPEEEEDDDDDDAATAAIAAAGTSPPPANDDGAAVTAEELLEGFVLEGCIVIDTETLITGIPAAEAGRTGSCGGDELGHRQLPPGLAAAAADAAAVAAARFWCWCIPGPRFPPFE